MIFRFIIVAGLACGAAACTEKQPAVPDVPQEAPGDEMPLEEQAPIDAATTRGSAAFIKHMHQHAKQLERLNAALAVGDLEAAQLPAFWLSRHESVDSGVDEWQPHLAKMRQSARAVENAADLEAARAAAEQIADGCRGCHDSADVDVKIAAGSQNGD